MDDEHPEQGFERLCRYVSRPPLSRERLRELPDSRIALRLKVPWDDGTTHLVFRPLELVRKLAALVPHPRFNLVVYHGVLAGNHRWRSMVVPPRPPSSEEGEPPKRRRRSAWIPWQELMKRTFGVSVLLCPRCQTLMVLRALVRTHEVSRKLLVEVLGLPWEPEQMEPLAAPVRWGLEPEWW